ncbi:MAG: glycoside hydrolase family 20 zincin-like fold domain-containing protein [Planctomycetota bacterium]|jgi:hypothetical protein
MRIFLLICIFVASLVQVCPASDFEDVKRAEVKIANRLANGGHKTDKIKSRNPNQASAKTLRLVPFPKQIKLDPDGMKLAQAMVIRVSDSSAARRAALNLKQELIKYGGVRAEISVMPASQGKKHWILSMSYLDQPHVEAALTSIPDHQEGYELVISKDLATVGSQAEAGLLWGIQTLRQLIRANMKDNAIPSLQIRDWPSVRYRGFQDDLTRGPSTLLDVLKREISIGSLLKQNFFTYYMEHQFEFEKHPVISPHDGCFRPEELKLLVQYAKMYGMEIIGNQQSFGHFSHILKHGAYRNLRETKNLLDPTNEASYKLLDDMYSAQIPHLESEFFNVCCDETYGLGTGPSKPLADKIGVGGIYARHIQRIHELISDKYGKQMMMWGDIILRHPEHLEKIPKDTVMLSWGYEPHDSFEQAIVPFAQSGYRFFVCPGVSCWNRILPDFRKAIINIQNYVRDGSKFGALGVLNTAWDDDGENFFAPNLHGIAWGAECAWNGSATSIEDFNYRIGSVLFGEPSGSFGKAIELLSKTHYLDGYDGMRSRRFWREALNLEANSHETAIKRARALLEVIDPALEFLSQAQEQARVNADLLDYFIFGAERMRLMASRTIDVLDTTQTYERAVLSASRPRTAISLLRQVKTKLQKVRSQHEGLKHKYIELWNRENKPYALDRVTQRFDTVLGRYGAVIMKLQQIIKNLQGNEKWTPDKETTTEILKLGCAEENLQRQISVAGRWDFSSEFGVHGS